MALSCLTDILASAYSFKQDKVHETFPWKFTHDFNEGNRAPNPNNPFQANFKVSKLGFPL